MTSSNNLLSDFAKAGRGKDRNPGFEVIIAFEYYDGPERGLAIYPSGEGVRFSSLGDSRSRLFRAYELSPIKGHWLQRVQLLRQRRASDPPSRVLVPEEAGDALSQLENDVHQALETSHFVGVGTPNFDQIEVAAVSKEQIDALRHRGCSEAGFRLAHQLVKAIKRSMVPVILP
jgi:hypothetical protein